MVGEHADRIYHNNDTTRVKYIDRHFQNHLPGQRTHESLAKNDFEPSSVNHTICTVSSNVQNAHEKKNTCFTDFRYFYTDLYRYKSG